MNNDREIARGIRRAVRGNIFLALEKEYGTQGRALRTGFSPGLNTYLKFLAAAAIGGAAGVFTVTSIYLVSVWLLHLQLY